MRLRGALVLVVVTGFGGVAFGQQPALLVEVAGSRAPEKNPVPDVAVRSRAVLINDAVLPTANTRAGARVRLNLFDDVVLDVALESLTARNSNRYTWAGRVTDDEYSSVTIAVVDDAVQANVHSPAHGNFQIRYGADGVSQVYEIDPSRFPACATGPAQAVTPTPALIGERRTPAARGTASSADVLVVYTRTARIAVGGTAAMEALIDLAIVESNDAYLFSLVDFALNLVGAFEVGYVESSGFGSALDSLRVAGDGILDEVHVARESAGADFVSLIISDSSSCGIGYLMTSLLGDFSGSAFSVEHYGCATGNFSFAHELGHNMGAMHDLTQSPGGGLFPDSNGWHWGNSTQPGIDGAYRSIMAYAPGTRVQRFSNPNVIFADEPTGLLNVANNALTLDASAPVAAAWRAPAAWITVLPQDGVNSIGDEGGPFAPSSLVFTLDNLDSMSANWTASSNQAWASLSSTSGSLGSGGTTIVTVNFGAAANALPAGLHTATVTFTDITNARVSQYNVRLLAIGQPSETVQYFFPMNTHPGWAATGQWQFGVPLGFGSNNPDPTSGHTGSNVYGYNLAGDYPNSMLAQTLTAAPVNCSNLENVGLEFWRWLGVENSTWDQASIQVSNNGVTWTNVWVHNGASIVETAWAKQRYDISAVANGQSLVFVRWIMGTTDSSVTFSGWNIDDVTITGDPVGASSSNDIWIDFSHTGVERGTQPLPYSSLEEGMTYLNPGGTLHLAAGSTDETIILGEPMTVIAEGGTVVIGLNAP